MYQPVHLDSFLRMLIVHLSKVVDEGERLIQFRSKEFRMDILYELNAVGEASVALQEKLKLLREHEILFAQQLCHAREWVDRLGQLDLNVERFADEFLATTFAIELLQKNRPNQNHDYRLDNQMIGGDRDSILITDLNALVDVDNMLCAIFELLGRLEDQYELLDEFLDQELVVNGTAFSEPEKTEENDKVVPIFPK